jgi:hypothetical protein
MAMFLIRQDAYYVGASDEVIPCIALVLWCLLCCTKMKILRERTRAAVVLDLLVDHRQ